MTELSGGCACGGVRYRIAGPLRPVVACHCETCRRTSGHYAAATACARDRLVLDASETLAWWDSSPGHRRAFCSRCGASLFWERLGGSRVSVCAGTLDNPTGLRLAGHIMTAEKGDYYRVTDDLPISEGSDATLTDLPGAEG